MKYGKAAGVTGVMPSMLKALPDEAVIYIAEIIRKFGNDESDCDEWHTMTITALYKDKGKMNDLDNWRGICLKELTVKIISSIVLTRLLTVLDKDNVKDQFATAIHSLRSSLGLRRQRGIETFVLCVDLIKVYDTVNHELLFQILLKYGIVKELVNAVKRMYRDCKVQVKVGKEKRYIDYKTGIQQGDNITPILSIFLMLEVYKTLEKKWQFKKPQFRHFQESVWKKIRKTCTIPGR
jgi:hypothetical protein